MTFDQTTQFMAYLIFSIIIIGLIGFIINLYIDLYKKIKKLDKIKDDRFLDLYKNDFISYNKNNFQTSIIVLNLILDNYFNSFMKHKKSILSKKNNSTANLNNKLEIDNLYKESISDILENYVSRNLIIQLNYFFTSQSLGIYICSYFNKMFDEIME